MLLRDILLENRRFNFQLYGAWLDMQNNQVIPVANTMGHSEYVQRNPKEFQHPPGGELSSIMLAYYNGYVRAVFNQMSATEWDISISGFDKHIKQGYDLIVEMMDTAERGKLEMSVLISGNMLDQLAAGANPDYAQWSAHPEQRFFFPADEKKLQSFIRSL